MTIADKDLIGAWELEEMYAEDENGARTHPMGRDAKGTIMYTPDHHMCAITSVAERFLPADRPEDADKAEAFSGYFNYAGKWSLDGDDVTHDVAHALDPNMVGMSLTRSIEHQGNRMVFTGFAPDGKTKNVIIWKRPG